MNADLQIHKVLSRGWGAEAQVLLVLVSTDRSLEPGEDLWVSVNRSEPVVIASSSSWQGIEAARALSPAELQALDLDWKPGQQPFGVTAAERKFWLARFDHSDHATIKQLWDWLSADSGREPDPRTTDVVAWISQLSEQPDAQSATAERLEPKSGHAVLRIALDDVLYQPLFELGVLFVHGIGDHGVRETLVLWAEPIVKLWRDVGRGIGDAARVALTDAQRGSITRRVRNRQLRNRLPIDGISQAVDDFEAASTAPGGIDVRTAPAALPRGEPAQICFTYAKAEQTLFGDIDPSSPSATLLRLSSVDADAVLRESHVLFAEAFWTRETFPPTFSELYGWLTTAIPIAVWARLQRLVSTRRGEVALFWKNATSGFDRFRVVVSALILVLQWIVMPGLYVAFGLASQILIGLIGVVGIVPIPWVKSLTRTVMSALLGTLGQSFALQTSVIRRAAIVSSVRQNLEWLSGKCHRVVVVSHSQGAEVSRLVFLDGPREKLARWYTAGSGIVPLAMLHPKSLAADVTRRVVKASRIALVVASAILLLVAIDSIPGVTLGTRALAMEAMRGLGVVDGGIVAVLFLVAALGFGETRAPQASMQLRRSVLSKWRDFYASDDPVPAGSLVDRFAAEFEAKKIDKPRESRIFNTRFALFDHTTYFRNVEQFVAPIALDLLRLMGMGFDERLEQPALLRAGSRRDLRTWWNMFVSVLGLCAFAATFAWIACGPPKRSAVWIEKGEALWAKVPGTWGRIELAWSSGFIGQVLTDIATPLTILAVLVVWWAVCRFILGRRSAERLTADLAAALGQAPALAASASPAASP